MAAAEPTGSRASTPPNPYKPILTQALDIAREALQPFVRQILERHGGESWHQDARVQRMLRLGPPSGPSGPALDTALLIKLIDDDWYWKHLFSPQLPSDPVAPRCPRWRLASLRHLRNRIAHDEGPDPIFCEPRLACTYLENIEAVLVAVRSGSPQAAQVAQLRSQLIPGRRVRLLQLLQFRSRGSKRFYAALLLLAAATWTLVTYIRAPKLQATTLVIGTPDQRLNQYRDLERELERRLRPYRLLDHLRGQSIDVVLRNAENYARSVTELKELRWDVALAFSPIVSMAAVEIGYRPIGVMFPDSRGYASALVTRSDSPYRTLSDLRPGTRLALGDWYSATKYYVPMDLLKGRTLTIVPNLEVPEILDLVRHRKADVGVVAMDLDQDIRRLDPDGPPGEFKVLVRGRPLPSSVIALSPRLSDHDRNVLKRVLLDLPAGMRSRSKANYGPGPVPDYRRLERLVAEVRTLSACLALDGGALTLACPPGARIVRHDLWIEDAELKGSQVLLRTRGSDQRPLALSIDRSTLAQLVSVETVSALKGCHIEVLLPATPAEGTIALLHPNQLEFGD